MLTTTLDFLGACFLALFAFAVWPPLCLAVVGSALLLISWRMTTASKAPDA